MRYNRRSAGEEERSHEVGEEESGMSQGRETS